MKTVLAFSGGKDSWACLWLKEKELSNILIVWIDTGKTYPEILETIEKAKALCPNFLIIQSNKDKQNEEFGLPSDLVPVDWTVFGQVFTGKKEVSIQPYTNCCYQNIGSVLQRFCEENGIETLIRGQRNDEFYKSPARTGTVVNGVTYEQPIEEWTEQEVIAYVATKMELPEHFKFKHSSMDCYDCTAYRKVSQDRIEYMRVVHPDLHKEYEIKKLKIDAAIAGA